MVVKIRLKRMGKKKQPSYRVVVADSRAPRDGRIIESIGRYDPRQEPSLVEIDNERAKYWLGNGAQPTERAQKLLEISGAVATSKVGRSGVYHLETSDAAPAANEAPPEASDETKQASEADETTADEVPAAVEPDGEAASADTTDETATPGGEAASADTTDETATAEESEDA